MISDEPMSWQVRRHDVLGTGHVSAFVDDEVVTPSGETVKRQYLTHPGAVAVVAWDEATDSIACLHQYRHPVRMELVEIPAGLLDSEDEEWVGAARRELAEEVALEANRWQVLVDICTTPGASEESLRIYLARGLHPGSRPDGFVLEGEEAHMRWEWVERPALVRAVLDGRCQNPSLVAGVLALEVAILGGGLDALRETDAPWPIRALRA